MKVKGVTIIFLALLCTLTLLVNLAIAAPEPVSVPEPTGILVFLGAAVAGIAAVKNKLKQ